MAALPSEADIKLILVKRSANDPKRTLADVRCASEFCGDIGMKRPQLNEWLTLIANVSVVAGIVFLAVETRQNTDALAAQAILALIEAGNNIGQEVSRSEDFAKLVIKGHKDRSSLTELETLRYDGYVQHMMNVTEAAWAYHQRGIITDDEFHGWQLTTCYWLSFPGIAELWRSERLHFVDGYRSSVESWC